MLTISTLSTTTTAHVASAHATTWKNETKLRLSVPLEVTSNAYHNLLVHHHHHLPCHLGRNLIGTQNTVSDHRAEKARSWKLTTTTAHLGLGHDGLDVLDDRSDLLDDLSVGSDDLAHLTDQWLLHRVHHALWLERK